MMRTITAKFPATCRRCRAHISKGSQMQYGGRGQTFHLVDADGECKRPEPVDVSDDPFAKTRSRGYFGSDAGRCEDAPCCGCC